MPTNWVVQGNLVWKTETLGLPISCWRDLREQIHSLRSEAFFGTATRVTVPLAQALAVPAASFGPMSRSSRSDVRTLSAYVQDQIDLGDHVSWSRGCAMTASASPPPTGSAGGSVATREDGKWSPRLGLIVKPRENLSFYASYAKSFLPLVGRSVHRARRYHRDAGPGRVPQP